MLVMISDELEAEFRKAVGARKGFQRGGLSEAADEAIRMWLSDNKATG